MKKKYTDLLKVGQGERKIHTTNCNVHIIRVVLSLGDSPIKCIILSGIWHKHSNVTDSCQLQLGYPLKSCKAGSSQPRACIPRVNFKFVVRGYVVSVHIPRGVEILKSCIPKRKGYHT